VEAGKRRAPVLEHADEAARGDRGFDVALEGQGQADAVEGGARHQLGLAEGERIVDIDLERPAALLELPAIEDAAREAIADAGVVAEVMGMLLIAGAGLLIVRQPANARPALAADRAA
jgi:hypothetical protein